MARPAVACRGNRRNPAASFDKSFIVQIEKSEKQLSGAGEPVQYIRAAFTAFTVNVKRMVRLQELAVE